MNGFLQDLRYALRQLRKAPGFTLTAVLTLALGIGANTAIFSLLDQALLRSLPVCEPQQLVVFEGTGKAWDGSIHTHGGDVESYFSYPMYKDLRDHNQAFEGLITTTPADIEVTRNGASQSGRAELVSGNYFNVLGVKPALGRVLTQADDLQPDANPVAVLSFDFWRDHLGARRRRGWLGHRDQWAAVPCGGRRGAGIPQCGLGRNSERICARVDAERGHPGPGQAAYQAHGPQLEHHRAAEAGRISRSRLRLPWRRCGMRFAPMS